MTTVAAEMVPTSNPQNAEPTVDGAVFTVNLPNFSGPFDLLYLKRLEFGVLWRI